MSGTTLWTTTHGDQVAVFERLRLRKSKRWYWNVTADNGEIVEHGEGYSRRIDAITAAERHHPQVQP